MRSLGLFFSCWPAAAFAGEYAVLASGARMHIDRHEADGAKVRLYHGRGIVEMDSTVVRGYEADEYVARYQYRRVAVAGAAPRGAGGSLRRPPRWNWRTPPRTDTVCRGNWCAA